MNTRQLFSAAAGIAVGLHVIIVAKALRPHSLPRMNRFSLPELQAARSRIAEVAQAILDGQIGIFAGCREIAGLRHDVDPKDEDRDLRGIAGIDAETDRFPLGDVRQYWDETALRARDAERALEEEAVRPFVIDRCRALVERYR